MVNIKTTSSEFKSKSKTRKRSVKVHVVQEVGSGLKKVNLSSRPDRSTDGLVGIVVPTTHHHSEERTPSSASLTE